ncbi:unnamed protein product [Urochloa humidicola]
MKASIKFRDDDRPLMRAKVPIGVLGLPFQSGVAAGGDPRELRFDLSTAFASGPGLRLSYRPNDPGLPFALTVRAGLGPLGSPARAPFALAAEFNLLSSDPSTPAFFLRLKPRLGDFSLSHTLRSHAADAGAASPASRKVGEAAPDGEREFGYKPSFSFTGGGLAADVAAAGTKSGVGALLSGMQLTTRSVLPLWGRASLRFNWGLRVPPELLADGGGSRKGAPAPVSKMPLLVMSKLSIEQSPRADADGGKCGSRVEHPSSWDALDGQGDSEVAAFSLARRQLESLNVDNMMLRRAVEDLRAEIRHSNSRAAAPVAATRSEGRVVATAAPPPQPHRPFPAKPDRPRGAAREPAPEKTAGSDDVGEELKKALEARLR